MDIRRSIRQQAEGMRRVILGRQQTLQPWL